jgi:stringent starvation protein B
MTSQRPYIMRALYQWILDNDCTPYLLVNAELEGVSVPKQYVKEGQIVLNISPTAIVDLDIGDKAVYFNGRFGGVPMDLYIPIPAVVAIYAKENGQGTVFEGDDVGTPEPEPPGQAPSTPGDKRPSLKVVK